MREGLGAVSRAVLRSEGDFEVALASAARVVTADYEVPYLANAPLEPWSCTAEIVADGSLDLWGPFQAQDRARTGAARTLGIDGVRVHTLPLGGGFGRHLNDDGVPAAALVARAIGKPVKLFWTRETGFRGGFRPAGADGPHHRSARPVRPGDGAAFPGFGPIIDPALRTGSAGCAGCDVSRRRRTSMSCAMRSAPIASITRCATITFRPARRGRSVGATQNAFFL